MSSLFNNNIPTVGNSLDIGNHITVAEEEAEAPGNSISIQTHQITSLSGVYSAIPSTGTYNPNDTLWATATGNLSGTDNFDFSLNPAQTTTLDVQMTMMNSHGSQQRYAGIAIQWQDPSAGWLGTDIPFQYQMYNHSESVCIRLVHSLPNTHTYTGCRILVRGLNAVWGTWTGVPEQQCYCAVVITQIQ